MDESKYDKIDNIVIAALDKVQWLLNNTINKLDRKRKIDIRVHRYDVWSADHTLALIIHPILIKLKEVQHGMPLVDVSDAPHIGEGTVIEDWHYDTKAEERWDYVLNEMIWAFQQIIDDDAEMQFHSGISDVVMKEVEVNGQTLYEMGKGPNDTRKFDKEGYERWMARKKNGLRLFGKYYESLWD